MVHAIAGIDFRGLVLQESVRILVEKGLKDAVVGEYSDQLSLPRPLLD